MHTPTSATILAASRSRGRLVPPVGTKGPLTMTWITVSRIGRRWGPLGLLIGLLASCAPAAAPAPSAGGAPPGGGAVAASGTTAILAQPAPTPVPQTVRVAIPALAELGHTVLQL